jgi:hypothetical protein
MIIMSNEEKNKDESKSEKNESKNKKEKGKKFPDIGEMDF